MYEAYRVRRRFQWRGWEFAPKGGCDCGCEGCTGKVASRCKACPPSVCRCPCNIKPRVYGGDIWIVEAGHPRKALILRQRFAIGDATLPSAEELMKKKAFRRLISPPGSIIPELTSEPEPVPAKEKIAAK